MARHGEEVGGAFGLKRRKTWEMHLTKMPVHIWVRENGKLSAQKAESSGEYEMTVDERSAASDCL